MAQAFLIHMGQFDRTLELELARLLDPIVDAPAPRRRRRGGGLRVAVLEVGLQVQPVPVVVPIVTPV